MTTPFPRKRIKAQDLRICTWNVRSLNKPCAVSQLETVLKDYKADIIALQEMRWTGQGQTNLSSCDALLLELGCGFAVRGNLRALVSRFTAVDERLAAILIKANYFYTSLICAHAPTEDKYDATTDAFYD